MEETVKDIVATRAIRLDIEHRSLLVEVDIRWTRFEHGHVVESRTQPETKKITLKNFSEHSDPSDVAAALSKKSNLIPASFIPQVEELLRTLKQSMIDSRYSIRKEVALDMTRLKEHRSTMEENEDFFRDEEDDEPAEMSQVNSYLEMLYEEDMEVKTRGTCFLSKLARIPAHLEDVAQNRHLLEAIARTLREDGSKNSDIAFHIIYIFYSFSHFHEFHDIIAHYKLGFMSLSMIDLELKRFEKRQASLDQRKQNYAEASGDRSKLKEEYKRESKKVKLLNKRQERILYVATHLLLNIAENQVVEKKMLKLNLMVYLKKMLVRDNPDLIALVLTFLKKLSIVPEYATHMASEGILPTLISYMQNSSDMIVDKTLRLLLNLSFETSQANKMVEDGIIPKLVDLFQNPTHLQIVLRLMYQLSIDDSYKSLFAYTDCIPMVTELILGYPEPTVNQELAALAVNLAVNRNNAAIICQDGNLDRLMARIYQTGDALLMKLARNISQHDDLKDLFKGHVDELARLVRITDRTDILVELFGVLGNLTIPEMQFSTVAQKHGLLDFMSRVLETRREEDDLILEVIILIGTFASDPLISPMIARSPLIKGLCDTIIAKQHDDEMILQTFYTFYKLMIHDATRDVLLRNTDVVPYMLDMLSDSNQEIRKMADQTIELVKEYDLTYFPLIRRRKFELYNAEWLRVIDAEEQGLPVFFDNGTSVPFLADGNSYGPNTSSREFVNGGIPHRSSSSCLEDPYTENDDDYRSEEDEYQWDDIPYDTADSLLDPRLYDQYDD